MEHIFVVSFLSLWSVDDVGIFGIGISLSFFFSCLGSFPSIFNVSIRSTYILGFSFLSKHSNGNLACFVRGIVKSLTGGKYPCENEL